MTSTFLSLHYHFVFSTKNREPSISREWRPRLHEYLAGTISGLEGFPQRVGGVADHVHLLVGLRATHCVADVVRELKKSSTRWIRDEFHVRDFSWQEGYGAFTVSPSARPAVAEYIGNQEEHHRIKTFREELIEMFTRAGIQFDLADLD